MTIGQWVWLMMGLGLIVYTLTGGADFGGGVWDLLASGRRRDAQRKAIEQAIAPIWEANHVWLIFMIVVCFSVFSEAFYVMSVALHIPITLALIGIVLRGVSFVFRIYGQKRLLWGRIFAWSSVLTPVFLGMILASLATGNIRYLKGEVTSGFFAGYTTLFALAVGMFVLVLFSLLAAVYLSQATSGALQNDFRKRAIATEIIAGVVSCLVLMSAKQAPPIWNVLLHSKLFLVWQMITAGFAIATIIALFKRFFNGAKFLVICQMTTIVVGFGFSMRGYIVYPDVTLENAGLHQETATSIGVILILGGVLLLPSLWYLFQIFKKPALK